MRRHQKSVILIGISVVGIGAMALLLRSTFSDRGVLIVDIKLEDAPPEQIVLHIDSIDLWHPDRGWHAIDTRERAFSTKATDEIPDARTLTLSSRTGNYERVRISLSRMERITQDERTEPLYHLLSTIVLTAPVTIVSNTESALRISFVMDQSLYRVGTSRDAYIPQIHIESRSGVASTKEGERVRITGGTLLYNQTLGMMPDGSMRINYRLPTDSVLTLENGEIRITSLPELLTPVEQIERELEAPQSESGQPATDHNNIPNNTQTQEQELPSQTSEATSSPLNEN